MSAILETQDSLEMDTQLLTTEFTTDDACVAHWDDDLDMPLSPSIGDEDIDAWARRALHACGFGVVALDYA